MSLQTATVTQPSDLMKSLHAAQESEIDLTRHFVGFEACFVAYDVKENTIRRFNPKRCGERFAPCSTFKVPHAAIALDLGVLNGPDHSRKWDGVQRWNEKWNRDHDLQSAMRDSVVWYFQETAREIGPQRMKTAMAKLNYGNGDCSGPVDAFWLGRPLAISADEQVAFMNRLRLRELPLSRRAQEITREVIMVDHTGDRVLYGKTGTRGEDGRTVLGWFVGWLEAGDRTLVFTANMSAKDGALGPRTRDIARAILAELVPNTSSPARDKTP
jgi:beta-lactamase class D